MNPTQSDFRSDPITAALEASEDPMTAPNWLRWKVGHHDPRLIYAIVPEGASPDADKRLGRMNTARLAEEVVNAHNAVLANVQRKVNPS